MTDTQRERERESWINQNLRKKEIADIFPLFLLLSENKRTLRLNRNPQSNVHNGQAMSRHSKWDSDLYFYYKTYTTVK